MFATELQIVRELFVTSTLRIKFAWINYDFHTIPVGSVVQEWWSFLMSYRKSILAPGAGWLLEWGNLPLAGPSSVPIFSLSFVLHSCRWTGLSNYQGQGTWLVWWTQRLSQKKILRFHVGCGSSEHSWYCLSVCNQKHRHVHVGGCRGWVSAGLGVCWCLFDSSIACASEYYSLL